MELSEHHAIISEKEKEIKIILEGIPSEYHKKISKILELKSKIDFHFREARKIGSSIQNKGGYGNGSYELPFLISDSDIFARARDIYYSRPESQEFAWCGATPSVRKDCYNQAKAELGIE